MSYSNMLSFSAGLLVASLIGLISCSGPQPQQVVETEVVEDPNFAAVNVFDCNELIRVVFITSLGRAETIKIQGSAHLFDMQLRLANVPYAKVHYVVNDRPCGFVIEDETL